MKDIKFPERTRASMGDMGPAESKAAPAPEPAPRTLQFKRFPNGAVLLHSPNPAKVGTRAIHDATGVPIAIVVNSDIAELFCSAVTSLFLRHEAAELARAQAAAELTEGLAMTSIDSNQSGDLSSGITPPLPPPFVPLPDPQLPPVEGDINEPTPNDVPDQDPGFPSHDNPPPSTPGEGD